MSNLASVPIAANVLTNDGDAVFAVWSGKLKISVTNAVQLQLVYGSETFLDTSLQIVSNVAIRAEATIVRTGNTGQRVEGMVSWPGGSAPFNVTNTNVELVQTNGIATTLALKGGSRVDGGLTNNGFRVYYDPAHR